jgi:hypothetical protein
MGDRERERERERGNKKIKGVGTLRFKGDGKMFPALKVSCGTWSTFL